MKLHEVLAVEKTAVGASNKLLIETAEKFKREPYFKGYAKSLKMVKESPEKDAMEASGSEVRELPTTVLATLDYALNIFAQAETLLCHKNLTNTAAKSDIDFDGKVIAEGIPVDELMGLEVRLETLRKIMQEMPTLDATKAWVPDGQKGLGVWVTKNPEITSKTEKVMVPVVLYEATAQHPAQVKEMTRDEVVGTYTVTHWSGAATSLQKAKVLGTIDQLIAEIKKARMRANSVEVVGGPDVGRILTDLILAPLMAK